MQLAQIHGSVKQGANLGKNIGGTISRTQPGTCKTEKAVYNHSPTERVCLPTGDE